MRHGRLYSSLNSDAVHPIKQNAPSPKVSECLFLENQAAEAKAAMIRTLLGMKSTVSKVADLRPYFRPHPWLVGVSALAVGFVAGAVSGLIRRRITQTANVNTQSNGHLHYGQQNEAVPKRSFLFTTAIPLLAALVQILVKNSTSQSVVPAFHPRAEGLSRSD